MSETDDDAAVVSTVFGRAAPTPADEIEAQALFGAVRANRRRRRQRALGAIATAAVVAVGACALAITWPSGSDHDGQRSAPGKRVVHPVASSDARRAQTEADVERVLRAIPTPPNATIVPDGGQYHLSGPPFTSSSPNFVDRARVWLMPGTVNDAFSYAAAHLPAGTSQSGDGRSTGPGGRTTVFRVYDMASHWQTPGLGDLPELFFSITTSGSRVVVRVDVTATFVPARTPDQYIPLDITGVDVTRKIQRVGERTVHVTHRRLGTEDARRLARDLNRAIPDLPGPTSCPDMSQSVIVTLHFTGGSADRTATASLNGCGGVSIGRGPGLQLPNGFVSDLTKLLR